MSKTEKVGFEKNRYVWHSFYDGKVRDFPNLPSETEANLWASQITDWLTKGTPAERKATNYMLNNLTEFFLGKRLNDAEAMTLGPEVKQAFLDEAKQVYPTMSPETLEETAFRKLDLMSSICIQVVLFAIHKSLRLAVDDLKREANGFPSLEMEKAAALEVSPFDKAISKFNNLVQQVQSGFSGDNPLDSAYRQRNPEEISHLFKGTGVKAVDLSPEDYKAKMQRSFR